MNLEWFEARTDDRDGRPASESYTHTPTNRNDFYARNSVDTKELVYTYMSVEYVICILCTCNVLKEPTRLSFYVHASPQTKVSLYVQTPALIVGVYRGVGVGEGISQLNARVHE